MSNKRVALILTCIIVVGAVLRLYHITFQSLWLEELQAVTLSDPKNHIITMVDISKSNGSQAFYMLLHFIYKIFGYNEVVGRVTLALFGIFSIPVCYLIGKEIEGHKTGLFASLLTTLNYYHIYFSQEINCYSMAFLFSTLSYLFFIRAYKYNKEADFAAYIISTVLLVGTHSFGLILLGVQIMTVIVLIRIYKPDSKFKIGFLMALGTTLIFIPWSRVLLNDIFVGYSWIPQPKIYFILPYFYQYFGKDIIITKVAVILIVLFFYFAIKKRQENNEPLYIILVLWLALPYLYVFVKSLIGNPILDMRFTIVFLPSWFFIIAIGWNKIKNKQLKLAFVTVIGLSSLINLFLVRQHYSEVQKQQLREASQLIKSKNTEGYSIYSSASWELNFYFQDFPKKVIPLELLKLDSINFDKFWLLQVEYSESELTKLNGMFEVAENHSFYQSHALLMRKKKSLSLTGY